MKIKLSEVPEEGRDYKWSTNTGEANAVLKDIIGQNSYEAHFFIRPLNSRDFEMTGRIITKSPEVCSRCGQDINFPVDSKFHEILIPKQSQGRTGKYSKVNHVSDLPDSGPEFTEYEDMAFDMGEYLHEVVALAIPFNPVGSKEDHGDCSFYDPAKKDQTVIYDDVMPAEEAKNPFAALKGVKIN